MRPDEELIAAAEKLETATLPYHQAVADLMRVRADQLRQDRRVEGSWPLTAKFLDLARLINGGAS